MAEESQESLSITLWSPGFKLVLREFALKYGALARLVMLSLTMTREEHYAAVKAMRLLRDIIKDVYKTAQLDVPQSIKATFNIDEE